MPRASGASSISTLNVATPSGSALVTVELPIPNAAALVGAEFFQQVAILDLNCYLTACNVCLRLSRGGHGVIG